MRQRSPSISEATVMILTTAEIILASLSYYVEAAIPLSVLDQSSTLANHNISLYSVRITVSVWDNLLKVTYVVDQGVVYAEQVIWWNRFYNYWYTHQDWETITYNYTITDGLNLTVPFNATSSDWVFISVYASKPNQEWINRGSPECLDSLNNASRTYLKKSMDPTYKTIRQVREEYICCIGCIHKLFYL